MPRSRFGKRLASSMRAKAEVEGYEGGCSVGPDMILCRDPEYGYAMFGLTLGFERNALHETLEPELGHRTASWFEIADDATLGLWHAQEGGRLLAALRDCPADPKVRPR